MIWEIIFEETILRNNNIQKQIQSLYTLFKHNYTSGKRNSRLPYIYHSIGYLTLPINFKIPLRNELNLFIQTQCNSNIMFKNKKDKEIKSYTPPPKITKKIIGIEQEKCTDKINIFKEIDMNL